MIWLTWIWNVYSQFADDTSIHKTNRNLNFVIKCVESDLCKHRLWCNQNDLKIPPTKIQVTLFTHRKIPDNTKINFNGEYLALEKVIKFLGMLFYCKLTWTDHIDSIVLKCNIIMNLLRCLCGSHLGYAVLTLFQLYNIGHWSEPVLTMDANFLTRLLKQRNINWMCYSTKQL